MSAPLGSSNSRFTLESHDHAGKFVCQVPYRDLQGEWLLNEQGQNLRGSIPYRNYAQITPANLYAGKHELWLFDKNYSTTDPIFAGPVWDITAGSDAGTLNFSAQDPLSYLTKRLLKTFKSYSGQRSDQMMNNLITYVNSQRTMNLIASVVSTSAQTSSQVFLSSERNRISDLLESISNLNDSCDYYIRCINGQHTMFIYGGQIIPSAKTFALEYGGTLDGYSVQYMGTTLANDVDFIGTNGLIGNAVAAGKQTEYDALYQTVDTADQNITSALNQTANQRLRKYKSTKIIPTLVTRKLLPFIDFDFGSQFTVSINDWYVQVSQLIRVHGWQHTISQGDTSTIVIYTTDTASVT